MGNTKPRYAITRGEKWDLQGLLADRGHASVGSDVRIGRWRGGRTSRMAGGMSGCLNLTWCGNRENVQTYLLSNIRPPRGTLPPAAKPVASRLSPSLSRSSGIVMFCPGRSPSRITKAAADREAMPPDQPNLGGIPVLVRITLAGRGLRMARSRSVQARIPPRGRHRISASRAKSRSKGMPRRTSPAPFASVPSKSPLSLTNPAKALGVWE